MDANHLIDLPAASPDSTPRPPSFWQAIALIALYFALQLAVASAIMLAAGLGSVLRHGGSLDQVVTLGRRWLDQPDMTAVAVIATLLVAATLVVQLVRRWWPASWRQAALPGLGFTWPAHPAFFAAALVVGVLMPMLGGLLTQWLAQGHPVSQDIKQLGAHISLGLRLPLALLVVTLGPLVEELLFRGVLLSALARYTGQGAAIVLSAALFACVHLPDLSFLWYALPNLALLGLVLGWLRVQSGSIWPAVLAHGVNNLLAVISWFVMSR